MSVPSQFAAQREGSEPAEDCRDFLRTGRCKYGASCKYNHPPNVQSGGGMKTPIDPMEPMFPIRPNEPVCQYYMKHGTCKFAQACKFNHPPQTSQHAALSGGTVLMMNVGRQMDSQPQLVLGPMTSELQFLPQRPDEPDCIYFLKNGRCKYGATCRYHHPLNYHQRRVEEQRRHHEQQRRHHIQIQQDRYQPVHYVTQPVTTFHQGHVYVADSSMTLVNIDRDRTQSYQPFSIITGVDGTASYFVPVGSTVATTEQGSSTSSIASSFDAAVDHVNMHGDGAGALWNRRNGSVNSLNVVHNDTRSQARILSHSASDGNISRRARTSSHGSMNEHTAYHDTGIRPNGATGYRGSPFETSQTYYSQAYGGQQRPEPVDNKVVDARSQMPRSRPNVLGGVQTRRSSRRGGRAREGDEGFTLMTSALLNMLDTPEEGPSENFSDDDMHQPPVYASRLDHEVDPVLFERLAINPLPPGGGYVPRPDPGDSSWSPTWQGASPGSALDNSAHAIHLMQLRQQGEPPPGSSHPHDPNVGLYLP